MDTPDTDLDTARKLAEAGVPIFLARRAEEFPHGGSDGNGYWLPRNWQNTEPDPKVLDDWQPGMAVCAVMGHLVDGIDRDPRSGGDLPTDLQPRVYGRQLTPSGGTHELVSLLGVRSKDGIFPGVDVKAGHQGQGHGFLYIAPTEKLSHGGELKSYEWETQPNLDALVLIGNDHSGAGLADVIEHSRRPLDSGAPSYDGLPFDQLDENQQKMATNEQNDRVQAWATVLADAAFWPDGQRDQKGRGWEALARDFAWAVASFAVCPWMPLAEDDARQMYEDHVPVEIAQDPKCAGKWYEGLLEKAAARPVELPPWSDFEPIDIEASKVLGLPQQLDEKHMARWLAEEGLARDWTWTPGRGWLRWDGKRWTGQPEEAARAAVGDALALVHAQARNLSLSAQVVKKLAGYLTGSKINALTSLLRGEVLTDETRFDARPDLLNVSNGVIDLRTGQLHEHRRDMYLTRVSEVNYRPGAQHPDWDKALDALQPEVADWMQVRFGQAATGYATSDDVLPIGQGQGSNGKTTLISAIRNAMGEHAVTVPDRLLHAGPNDHPTELTTLLGARMAFIDETPEAAHLNVPRLKAVLGSEEMTARRIARDNITWRPTHSLFVITNYIPVVRETDHGTWRRLALVKFDKKFSPDGRFRARLASNRTEIAEAVLAWIVEGARRWYDAGRVIPPAPPKVKADTEEWRGDTDLVGEYLSENIVFSPESMVLATDLLEDFNQWLVLNGQKPWSMSLFSARMRDSEQAQAHGVEKTRKFSSPQMVQNLSRKVQSEVTRTPSVWTGVKFAADSDFEDLL